MENNFFNMVAIKPSSNDKIDLPENWNPWVTPAPYNPYDNVTAAPVIMTTAQSDYSSNAELTQDLKLYGII